MINPSDNPSIHPFIKYTSIHSSIYLSIHASINSSHHSSIQSHIYSFMRLCISSIHPSICIYPSMHLSIYQIIYLFIYPSIYSCIHSEIQLHTYPKVLLGSFRAIWRCWASVLSWLSWTATRLKSGISVTALTVYPFTWLPGEKLPVKEACIDR